MVVSGAHAMGLEVIMMFVIIIRDNVVASQGLVVSNAINVWKDIMDFRRKDVEVIWNFCLV